jgi:hypothetical protein
MVQKLATRADDVIRAENCGEDLKSVVALMIGVRRQANPALCLAGDALGGPISRESFPGQRSQPRKPAWAVRLRSEIQ